MWQSRDSFLLTDIEKLWLYNDDSLTQAMTELSQQQFSITVKNEFFTDHVDETFAQSELPLEHENYFIREVILSGKNIPWLYARSIFPKRTLEGHADTLLKLGNTALGTYLFARCALNRENVKLAHIHSPNLLYQKAVEALGDEALPALWARCSTFWLDENPLLVTEAFLPDFWKACETSTT